MLSRRSVRIKVMQQLYALDRDGELSSKEAMANYDLGVKKSYELCNFATYILLKIAVYAKTDNEHRKKKHIKTVEDQTFSDKLGTNACVQSMLSNESFEKAVNNGDFDTKLDEDFVKKMYREYVKTEAFAEYLNAKSSVEDDRRILLDLFRFCRNHDLFKELVQDHYSSWQDDKSLVIGMMKKLIKALPVDGDYLTHIQPVDDEVEDFGRELLKTVIAEQADFDKLIEPKLENWDAERLAILDTIVLRMALGEFLHFKTIPKKVTLNEYVDISKNYSTAKSKDFINGLLDRLMKDLSESGAIVKEGRGLID